MWFVDLLTRPSAIQAVIVLSAVCALGLSLAKFRFRGISLGITFVFFAGILAGALGLKLDPQMLSYAESFGLILFVYALGLHVGPGFVTTFRHGGTVLNILSIGVVLIGTVLAVLIALMGWLPFTDLMGVLCGATTNTPALGAAQQTLKQLGQPSAVAALSCAVTYPIGMIGVIVVLVIMRGWLQRHDHAGEEDNDEEAYITSYCVRNPALFGHTIHDIVSHAGHTRFVVSRLWREGKVIFPNASTEVNEGDRLLIITRKGQVHALTNLSGAARRKTGWRKTSVGKRHRCRISISPATAAHHPPRGQRQMPARFESALPVRRDGEPHQARRPPSARHTRPDVAHGRPRDGGGTGRKH